MEDLMKDLMHRRTGTSPTLRASGVRRAALVTLAAGLVSFGCGDGIGPDDAPRRPAVQPPASLVWDATAR
jgi:hypothetical protein